MTVADKVASVRWYHRIEISPGVITPGTHNSPYVLRHLGLPENCRGFRALDIGTRDGFFAFELERRGADVVAVDYMPMDQTGFAVASELLGSRVRYVQENIYNLRESELGQFDVVLFLGILYHLPDPLGALGIVRSLCRDRLFLETQVLGYASSPLMQFCPAESMNNDPTNFWIPNVSCVQAMLEETQFKVLSHKTMEERAIFRCVVTDNPLRRYHLEIARGLQRVE